MSPSVEFQLSRDAFGKLLMTSNDGIVHTGVVPVRAFPISAPALGIAIVSQDGRELAWIEHLDDLPPAPKGLLLEELAHLEFMPEIRRILKVSGFATPCVWTVATDRGETHFILKSEDSLRRLADRGLLVADSHGIQFLIRDRHTLDRHSRRLLDRFL